MKKLNPKLKRFINGIAKIYFILAFTIGTLVLIAEPISYLLSDTNKDLVNTKDLPNGFQIQPSYKSEFESSRIKDQNGNTIIYPSVIKFMWHEDYIYGFRRGSIEEIYYFVCKYGDDCTDKQHLNDIEFEQILIGKGLPEFSRRSAKSLRDLNEEK